MSRTKFGTRNESRARQLPKARRLRRKRRFSAPGRPRVRGRVPELRGKGPAVRNVELCVDGGTACKRCTMPASKLVTWESWHRGSWRRRWRRLCDRHARSLKSQLGRAE